MHDTTSPAADVSDSPPACVFFFGALFEQQIRPVSCIVALDAGTTSQKIIKKRAWLNRKRRRIRAGSCKHPVQKRRLNEHNATRNGVLNCRRRNNRGEIFPMDNEEFIIERLRLCLRVQLHIIATTVVTPPPPLREKDGGCKANVITVSIAE